MKASFSRYILNFKVPGGTSRGIMTQKETWFLCLEDEGRRGIGECGLLRGLSHDDQPDYENQLEWLCKNINQPSELLYQNLQAFPSIRFGLEQGLASLSARDPWEPMPGPFTEGKQDIPINGLIWMGDKGYMKSQIDEKVELGFDCLKMKIGAIDFETELEVLRYIRSEFGDDIVLRVDANGAFAPEEALEKLKRLSEYGVHSIEQPVKAGLNDTLAALSSESPVPIALDESLIGVYGPGKKELLQAVMPQFLILKPSLLGGMAACEEWIQLAEALGIGWWVTSALESNVGLNAIAQWTSHLEVSIPQGLGTGSLFSNNFDSPLTISGGSLSYNHKTQWPEGLIDKICI